MHKQFKVTLKHCKPTIWRRFTLDEGDTFEDLHEAIQDSFGWMSCHLWQFQQTGRGMEVIAAIDFEEMEGPVAHEVPLSSFFRAPKVKCLYVYDFGDDWTHEVVFEKAVAAPEGGERALLAGGRACPPEDSGGPYAYENLVEFVRTGISQHCEDPEYLRELLGDWDPDAFDLEEAKRSFAQGSFELVAPIPGDDSGVMELVEAQARKRGLGEDYIEHALAVWNDFYHANGGPGRRRARTHAACVDYVTSNLDADYMPLTQQDVARLHGVSAPSISNNYRDYGDPDEFVSRYSWVPDGVAARGGGLGDGFDLMRMIAMSGDMGFVPAVAPRRPGACWLFELDDAVPDALALVCRDGNLDVRMRMGLDELAMPSPAEIIREFLMPCVVFVQPSYVPEEVILAHPIFEACAEHLEEFGARVERRYDLASPEVARPGWLDDALAARLLRALEGCAARSPALAGTYMGSVEREGGIVRFLSLIHI